jgi:hypothetical protein
MFLSAISYRMLGGAIAATHFAGNAQLEKFSRASGRKNQFALVMNVLAMAVAWWHPAVAMAMVLSVALSYFVPGAWIE